WVSRGGLSSFISCGHLIQHMTHSSALSLSHTLSISLSRSISLSPCLSLSLSLSLSFPLWVLKSLCLSLTYPLSILPPSLSLPTSSHFISPSFSSLLVFHT